MVDLKTNKIVKQVKLPAEAYSCILSPDEKNLYISIWGDEKVVVYNTASQNITKTIKTGSHPNELLLNKKGTYLFVANANDNSVSIINTTTEKTVETVSTALYPYLAYRLNHQRDWHYPLMKKTLYIAKCR